VSSRIVEQIRARTRTPRARLLGGSAVLLTGLSIVTLSNFIYNIAVARYLGPEAYGHTTAVYTLLVLISAVTLSIQILTAKIVAQRPTSEARSLAYREFHRWGWAAGIFVSSLLLLCRNSITGYLNLPGSILIVLLAIGTTFYVPLGARRGYLQGTCSFPRLAGNLVLEAFTRLGGSFLLIQLGLGVPGVIAANSAAVVAAYFCARPRLVEIDGAEPALSVDFRESLQAAVFFAGQVVINNCDIVVVKHFFDAESAGLYAAVAMVGRVVFAFSWSIVNSLFPISAETHSRKQDDHGLLGIAMCMVSAICVLFMLGLRLAPSEIWPHLFGAQFRTVAGNNFRYLLILYALSAAVYSLSVVLIAYEMSHKIANTGWLQLLVGAAVVAGIYVFHSSLAQVIWVQVFMMALLVLFVSVPYFTNLFRGRSGRVKGAAVPGLVKLRRRVNEDEVIAEFLKTDFHAPEFEGYQLTLHDLVNAPDLENDGQNQVRRALFNIRHRSLWKQLPADTEWYEGELTAKDLERIRVFPRAQWRRFGVGDFDLTEVTHRLADTRYRARANAEFLIKIDQLRRHLEQESTGVGAVLLIGLDERGPFTILDGNHRMVAAMLSSSLDLSKFRFFCGLSPNMAQCCWYRTNVATLTRYGRHRVWHYTHDPEKELHRVLQLSSTDPQTLLGDYPLRGQ
jgi:O-antigen/teichoic acid export membrane protein